MVGGLLAGSEAEISIRPDQEDARSVAKRPRDVNQLAKLIVDLATGETDESGENAGKDPAAVERGRKGGTIGGRTRAARLSPEQRREIAQNAARARWAKQEPPSS